MKKFIYLLLFLSFTFCSSKKAALTIYKDGTALIKQPVEWSIQSGYNYVVWGDLPDGIHKDTVIHLVDEAMGTLSGTNKHTSKSAKRKDMEFINLRGVDPLRYQ